MGIMAAAIIGGSMMASGAMTNSANASLADSSNQLSLASAQNKYQWTVADMKAAGLNPMLAYSQGAQGVGSITTPTMQNPVGPAVNAAVSAYQANANVDNTEADTANKQTQNDLLQAQADESKSRTLVNQYEAVSRAVNAVKTSGADTNLVQSQIEQIKQNMGIKDPMSEVMKVLTPYLKDRLAPGASAASSTLESVSNPLANALANWHSFWSNPAVSKPNMKIPRDFGVKGDLSW